MDVAPRPVDDDERVAALDRLGLLRRADGDDLEALDRIARLAARSFDVPVAYVSLLDRDTWHLVSGVGVPPMAMPRDLSLCSHTILSSEPLVLEDARLDPRFADSPAVTGAGAVFYAGQPVRDPVTGHRVGTLCLVDRQPRRLDDRDLAVLDDLTQLVEVELTRDQLVDLAAALDAERAGAARSARLLSSVLGSTVEAIVGVDGDGRVTFANEAAARMFRHEDDGLLGRDLHATVHGHEDAEAGCPVLGTLGDGRSRHSTDQVLRRRDGSTFPAEVHTAPFVMGDEQIGVVVTVLDVSRRRDAEAVRRQFVSSVSHELRTPLTSIVGSLSLLANGLSGEVDDEARGVVDIARSNADRLLRLTSDLLEVERLQQHRMVVDVERVPVREVVDGALAGVAGLAQRAGGQVEVTGRLDGDVPADGDRLVQVLVNLLANAVRHAPGSTVRLEVERRPTGLCFHVVDDGPGIAPQHLSTIFEPFGQVPCADGQAGEGTGLGLTIAAGLVEAHDGRIWVDSEVGVGTAFHVWIPTAATPAAIPCAEGPP